MNERAKQLMDFIDLAANEKEIQEDQELFMQLVDCRQRLNNNESVNFVSVRLRPYVSRYLVANKYQAPKSLMNVATEIGQRSANYVGHAQAATAF